MWQQGPAFFSWELRRTLPDASDQGFGETKLLELLCGRCGRCAADCAGAVVNAVRGFITAEAALSDDFTCASCAYRAGDGGRGGVRRCGSLVGFGSLPVPPATSGVRRLKRRYGTRAGRSGPSLFPSFQGPMTSVLWRSG